VIELFESIQRVCRGRAVSGSMQGSAFAAATKVAYILVGLILKFHAIMWLSLLHVVCFQADRQSVAIVVLSAIPALTLAYFLVMGWQFRQIRHDADWTIGIFRLRPGARMWF
jgi:hypothetical protein